MVNKGLVVVSVVCGAAVASPDRLDLLSFKSEIITSIVNFGSSIGYCPGSRNERLVTSSHPSLIDMGEPAHQDNNGEQDEKAKVLANKALQIMNLMEQLSAANERKQKIPVSVEEHKFWDTQPVSKSSLQRDAEPFEGPIEQNKTISEVKKDSTPLPEEFAWCEINLEDQREKSELYFLLNQNYVEDIESLFRFDYPPQFLEWALRAPNWIDKWHVGVRVRDSKKLVAFISAIPLQLNVRGKVVPSVEVNFLCVHKKLRSKRLAPLLIKEITRRVHLEGIFQALYTAGAVLPGILSSARYYHRPINFKKLLDVGFTAMPLGKTLEKMNKKYHLAKDHQLGTILLPMRPSDAPEVTALLSAYTERFAIHSMLSEDEVRHWLLPRSQIMHSYVVVNPDGKVSDFISFYSLPSTVVASQRHSRINVAYLFYYAASSDARLLKLVRAALVEARKMDFDVFNCVDIMQNHTFLKELQFGEGDGNLNYYLYNWRTAELLSKDIAVVML